MNTYLQGGDYFNSRTYPYGAHGKIIGQFPRLVDADKLQLFSAITGKPWTVERAKKGGTEKVQKLGTKSDPEWRSARLAAVLDEPLLRYLLGL